jgi:hypothetical protein
VGAHAFGRRACSEDGALAGPGGPRKHVPESTAVAGYSIGNRRTAHWHKQAREPLFSGVGEKAYYKAEVRGALCSPARTPPGGVGSHMSCWLSI